MANEIYSKSWWGSGVCDNTVGWGLVYKPYAGCGSVPALLLALETRATYYENEICTTATLDEIEAIEYTAPPAPTGLLADYPNAAAAYSLRNLISTTTNVVRVRRTSDNTEQDFTAAEITDGTLTTFTGASDGRVTTWYDQSGNSVDLKNTTALRQPILVYGGVLELDATSGKPTLSVENVGNGYHLNTVSNYSIPQPSDYFVVGRVRASNNLSFLIDNKNNSSPNRQYIIEGYASVRIEMSAGTPLTVTSSPTEDLTLYGALYNGINSKGYIDGQLLVTGDAGADSQDWGSMGSSSGSFPSKSICEIIVYPSDQSSNRTSIETNINTEYTIY